MVKFFEGSASIPFTWDHVAQAFWRRYPNPHSTHVLTEDTFFQELQGHKLYSKRLFIKTNKLPKWGEAFVSSRTVCIVEESIVDPKLKSLITYTRNIGFNRAMTVEEKTVYTADPQHQQWTLAKRQAWISSSLFGFKFAIEAFGLERYKKNATKATLGFMHVLKENFGGGKARGDVQQADDAHKKLKDAALKWATSGKVSL
ncbi:unnamed protein product [Darwinula stevensoni]|uniref:PRELI/MSF1 domain-containing protein n=1 Tax=Darwinula stevensoni TaxID=69355 RepID=A0A7R8X9C7_9CRUS|nr:unnamed protein product [Darwinula stevensoni]CAG0891002.1 unnamed protein product [Darwinula stevensoni]